MKNILEQRRRSGLLAHITSLPSVYGIGDIGPASQHFIDFLADSGQGCWQFLPLSPTNPLFDNSPYMSSSAFAGSPLLISPDLLVTCGLIDRNDLVEDPRFSPFQVDYPAVREFKSSLLAKAYNNFSAEHNTDYETYITDHPWLVDYGLFMALKELFQGKGWFDWPHEIASRQKNALATYRDRCRERINYYLFEQYIFHSQWQQLRSYANDKGVLLFGDIPIYVGLDSVDVWAHQDIYVLDQHTGLPTHVAGVPPDYFSATGQRWGNPLYRWNSPAIEVTAKLENWWVERFQAIFEMVDIARIDHFRAFESYWAIPAEESTAIKGTWLPGPGAAFFHRIFERLGPLNIIAEDLGIITEEVTNLRDHFNFPGMKVLQFAFDGNKENSFLPYNFTSPNCVVYTGTHDNDTSVGWYLDQRLDDNRRSEIKRYANRSLHDASSIHDDLIYLALSSIANLAIIPLQDILGFGNDCRMNTPGVATGNWRWRCAPGFLNKVLCDSLAERTKLFYRHNDQFFAKSPD